ncbi:putative sterigmatocystin 8-O-methyltransferase [Rosellinia necatrix]|uniref:Putative sterigmatocystin 8-O-methyltransferase n=1 Tax=Rosellinia necatrix TaxID=77044 RepID=A0A1W2TAI1_ROSNE|nr:putative sterigmatocystin 8-O-methyltransferase [Rosellinia necatrix]
MSSSGGLDPRIIQLARTISISVSKIDAVLASRGLPSPSFDEDAPMDYFPSEVHRTRDTLVDATAELHDLLLEPLQLIKEHGGSNNSLCLQAIARYGIANLVPPGRHVSFAELARQTTLNEQMMTRLLRHAMTMRIFREPEPGQVAHTKASKLMARPHMNAWLRIGTHDMWPAATKMLDALEKWPGSQEPSQTGFCLSKNSTESIYDFVGSDPERSAQFAEAMMIWASRPDYAPSHAVDGYDWASLSPGPDCVSCIRVVDIGGAQGHVAVALARRFPRLEVVVQDMAQVVTGAAARLPADLRDSGRVRFAPHDFFAPQSLAARAYLFRWVLHNWADKYCVAILRAQISAMTPGARVIVMDTVMPDPREGNRGLDAVPAWVEKDLRSEDLNMGAVFNSRERTLTEWRTLFAEADSRFVWKSVYRPEGSTLSLMEVEWSS